MAILINGEEVGITGPELPAASTFSVDRGTFEVRSFFGGTQAEVRVTDLSQTQPAGRYRLRTASDVISIDRAASATGNPWDTSTTVWSAASSGAQTITVTDAVDATVLTALTLNRNTTNALPAAGLGVRLSLGVETSTTINTQAAAIDALWTTITHATRTADLVVSVVVSGTLTEGGRIDGSGSAWVIGNGDGGVVAATGWTVRAPDAATGGAGNVAGADLTISPGLGTGTGDEGTVIFSLPIQAAAGDNIQTRATRMTMDMAGSSTQLTIEAAQAALYRTADRGATNAAGFALALTAGNGGTAVTTGNNGGAVTFTTGNATVGAAGTNAGGNGGAMTFTGGTGADGGVASGAGAAAGGGGVGSAFNWTLGIGGIGGAASGADAAGTGGGGGTLTLTAGAGGAGGAGSAGAASGSGGAGGSLVLIPGAGGAAGADGGGGAGSAGAQGTVRVNDNFDFAWGTDSDIRARNISAGIAANTAIAGFSVGTPVSQAAAANSFGLSNVTANGDVQGLVNNGGNSLEWLLVDTSAKTISLGFGTFTNVTYSAANSTNNSTLTVENTSNAAAASHSIVDIKVGGTTSTGEPQLRFTIPGGTSWVIGPDNSTSDLLCINTGTVVGPASNTLMTLHAAANVGAGDTLIQFARAPGTYSLASAATAVVNQIVNFQNTVNYTGATTVTSLFEWVKFAVPTLVSNTPTLTVDKATNLSVGAPSDGANTSITVASAIRVLNTADLVGAQHGIYIEDLTGGATDYGLTIEGADTACIWVSSAVDTTDAANGIVFGLSRDTNLYRSAANTLATDDNVAVGLKVTSYNAVATVGWGVPAVYGTGRSTAQTGAVATVATYTVGAADGTFLVGVDVLVTTATNHSFTVTVTYTDEGNTARTLTFSFVEAASGNPHSQTITNTLGAIAYGGIPITIRCKAATAITIATTGTFTTVTYNVEGHILQIA